MMSGTHHDKTLKNDSDASFEEKSSGSFGEIEELHQRLLDFPIRFKSAISEIIVGQEEILEQQQNKEELSPYEFLHFYLFFVYLIY